MQPINSITIHQPTESSPTLETARPAYDLTWCEYFDIRRAIISAQDGIMQLDGANTEERHTWRAYSHALYRFFLWGMQLAMQQQPSFDGADTATVEAFFTAIRHTTDQIVFHPLPNSDLLNAFISYIRNEPGNPKSNGTINQKYLSPLRRYFRSLYTQEADVRRFTNMAEYIQYSEWRQSIRNTEEVKVRAPKKSRESALWSQGIRLNAPQVNTVLRAIDRDTLAGKRDYALLLLAFSSGLRIAELRRISLSSIRAEGDGYLITVRGKRQNMDPVPVSSGVYTAVLEYVYAYNSQVDPDDPRHIDQERPIWRPLDSNDTPRHHTGAALSISALSDAVKKRITAALDGMDKFAAHDTRRTCAYLAYKSGMHLSNISRLLRHADISTTARYIGVEPDYSGFNLSTYVSIGA
jgi:site-specific recombinase XerD